MHTRKLDNFGRVTLPKDVKKLYNIQNGDDVLIETSKDGIVIKKKEEVFINNDSIVVNDISYTKKYIKEIIEKYGK